MAWMDAGAIVVGGGHNGLVCAAYLAKAGLSTIVVEARSTVGGCASTVDALDGARVNICNCDHTVFRTTPVIDELGLADHGLRYLDVEPAQQHVPWDGGPMWPLFHDVERTLDGLQLTYPDQVDGYRRYVAAARPVAELVVELANHVPTRRHALERLLARRGQGITTLLRWSRMTVAAVLEEFFTVDALRAPAIATGPAVWGMSPHTPRTGLGALSYAMKHVANVGRPVGGSGAVPAALQAVFEANGGVVRAGATVSQILVEGSRVRGVRLVDGTELLAPIVVSACDPRETFVSWLGTVPSAARSVVDRWRRAPVQEGYESKLDAVVDELPFYRQSDARAMAKLGVDPMVATTAVCPSVAGLADAHRLLQDGRVAQRPILLANVPSALDPTMQPGPGQHVFSLEVLFTPYALAGGWPSSNEPERWLAAYGTLVQPGWTDHVVRHRTMTPDRYETEFHMPRGHATSFGGSPLSAVLGRPRELTRYTTPITGLYLTGAATYPGAGVWGASGRNCANVVLASSG